MPIVGDRRNPYPPPAEVLYFLIHDEERREKGYKFPSPLGELYFLIRAAICMMGKQQWFPSPLGELYFLMLTTAQLEQVDLLTVSVPSRGAIFLNQEIAEILRVTDKFPSPLGELYFLILNEATLTGLGYVFPSPLGELYFLINRKSPNETLTGVSVPSRGAIFLNRVKRLLISSGNWFPSPLGELYFLMRSSGY